jgi:hypothetical protein
MAATQNKYLPLSLIITINEPIETGKRNFIWGQIMYEIFFYMLTNTNMVMMCNVEVICGNFNVMRICISEDTQMDH